MLSTCKGPEKWRDRGERAREEPAKSPSTLFFISGVGVGGVNSTLARQRCWPCAQDTWLLPGAGSQPTVFQK